MKFFKKKKEEITIYGAVEFVSMDDLENAFVFALQHYLDLGGTSLKSDPKAKAIIMDLKNNKPLKLALDNFREQIRYGSTNNKEGR